MYFKFQGGFKRPNPNPINYVLCAHYFNLCIAVGCNTTTTAVTTVTTAATIATTATITETVFTRGRGRGGGVGCWSLFFGYHGAKFYSIASNFNYESQAFVGINAIAVITVAVVAIIVVVVVGGDVNESIIRDDGGSGVLIFGSSMGIGIDVVVCWVQGLITAIRMMIMMMMVIGIPRGSSGGTGIRF